MGSTRAAPLFAVLAATAGPALGHDGDGCTAPGGGCTVETEPPVVGRDATVYAAGVPG
jgi:hypothetical protein